MNEKKFQGKYPIASSRLQSWDYGSNGMYFITICTGGQPSAGTACSASGWRCAAREADLFEIAVIFLERWCKAK